MNNEATQVGRFSVTMADGIVSIFDRDQFVSSYRVSDLHGRYLSGMQLNLQGDVPEWTMTAEETRKLFAFISPISADLRRWAAR